MNFYQIPDIEIYVTEKLADIRHEVEQRNYVRAIERANAHIPGWVANQMHNLSVWMIQTGERIHEHYHTPAQIPHLHQRSAQTR